MQFGARSWMEPFEDRDASLSVPDYLVASRLALCLPPRALPVRPDCARCHRGVSFECLDGGPGLSAVEMHAGSHGDLLNSFVHKPVVGALVRMFRLHGWSASFGDEIGSGPHAHSADLTVCDFYGVGEHLRIDVKSGCEFNASNRSSPGWARGRECSTYTQHAGSTVLPFVLGVGGSLGPAACKLLKQLGRSPTAALPPGVRLSWTVPSHSKYWHRHFRVLALSGWAKMLRVVAGDPTPPVIPDPPVASLDSLCAFLRVPVQSCPACTLPRESCGCMCGLCGDPASEAWPPCGRCGECAVCCCC